MVSFQSHYRRKSSSPLLTLQLQHGHFPLLARLDRVGVRLPRHPHARRRLLRPRVPACVYGDGKLPHRRLPPILCLGPRSRQHDALHRRRPAPPLGRQYVRQPGHPLGPVRPRLPGPCHGRDSVCVYPLW